MSVNMVKFRHGTYLNYKNLVDSGNFDENTLYFITDEGNARLYKGDKLFTQQWEVVNGLPSIADGKTDRLYIDTLNNKLSYFNGTTYADALQSSQISVSATVAKDDSNAVSSHAVYTFVTEELGKISGDGTTAGTFITEISAGDTSGTLVVKQGETSTNVTLKNIVIDPTWDSTTRILTLPNTTSGKELTINLGRDMVVSSGSYNATTKELELVIGNNDQTVKVPVGDLVDIYTASTDTAGAVQLTVSNNAFKGEILVDGTSILSIKDGKLTADLSSYVTNTTFNNLVTSVNAIDTFLSDTTVGGNNLNTRIDSRLQSTKNDLTNLTASVANLDAAYKSADASVLNDAKAYTNTAISGIQTNWGAIGS